MDKSGGKNSKTWDPKKGAEAMRKYLDIRQDIYNNPALGKPITWPVQDKLKFGKDFPEILQGFDAIAARDIVGSVEWLAWHEQRNILQPVIYDDAIFADALRANQLAYVTDLPGSTAIQLTLSAQCSINNSKQTVNFTNNSETIATQISANLADPDQRMPFVLRAADRFNTLLHDPKERPVIEKAIKTIATNGGG